MIIGNGLIANAFLDYSDSDNVIIFASGVSNSLETNEKEFELEKELIYKSLDKNKTLVYFSSAICYDKNKEKYIDHKREIEKLIRDKSENFIIIRLPQVIGNGGNKNTLINFLVNRIKNDEEINVYDGVKRSLIDVEDLKNIVDYLLKQRNYGLHSLNHIELISIERLVILISKKLKKYPKIKLVPGEKLPKFDNDELINDVLKKLGIDPNGYTDRLIKKYIQ